MISKIEEITIKIQNALPTVYDDSLSFYELVNKVVRHLNTVTTTTNDVVDLVTELNEWIRGTGLQETVDEGIDKKIDDGTIQELINGKMFKEFSDELKLKATIEQIYDLSVTQINKDKGKLDQTYMSESFLQQITGNAPVNAIPPDEGVTSKKIAPKSVKGYHLDFIPVEGIQSKNLFNKNAITPDKYVGWNTGTIATNTTYNLSDFIRITSDTDYALSYGDQIAFYDYNQNYLSGVSFNTTPNIPCTFMTPSNAVYLRFNIPDAKLDTALLEKGTVSTTYEPYGNYQLTNNTIIKTENMKEKSISISILQESPFIPVASLGKNLFNYKTVELGKYLGWNTGNYGTNPDYAVSDFIEVTPNTDYMLSIGDQILFYDVDKRYISGISTNSTPSIPTHMVTPSNCKFVRFDLPISKLKTTQFELGNVNTTFAPYSKTISPDFLPVNLGFKNVKQIMNKLVLSSSTVKVKLLGDSITAGVGGTGYAPNGETIFGSYKVNTNGKCWGNSLKSYFESKFNCSVKNFGISGITSETIVTNISSLIKSDDDIIICMIGTNDRNPSGQNSKQYLYNNLVTIASYVKDLGKEIIFMSNIPSSVSNETSVTRLFHMEDVDHIVMKASTDSGIEYISLYKEFINYCDVKNIAIDSLLADGLHPNDSGYDVMFNIVSNELGIGTKRVGATW